jgi:CRISPR/Cas system endoribonuclease Cas6 (RAMP superfamily)
LENSNIKRHLRKGISALRKSKSPDKELDRFVEIYTTVYRHAKKKGQSHKQALNYCWNVYSEQAPDSFKRIIKKALRKERKMKLERTDLRKMIMKEMLEGEVIKLADYQAKPEQANYDMEEEQPTLESVLSDVHDQMLDFMNENFDDLDPDKQQFLDSILDQIEEFLGIDEEGIDFGADEEDEDL